MTQSFTATPLSPTLHDTAHADQSAPVDPLSFTERQFIEARYVGVTDEGALSIITALRSVPCPWGTDWCKEGGLPHDVCRQCISLPVPSSSGLHPAMESAIERNETGDIALYFAPTSGDLIEATPDQLRTVATDLIGYSAQLAALADEFEAIAKAGAQ